MSKSVALLLIALAAGLGLFVGRWSAHRSELSGEVETLPESASPTGSEAPAPRATPDLAARGDPVADAFRDALAKLPTPEPPRGSGSIRGTVLAADGQPIPGAVVAVRPWPQDGGRRWASPEDMEPAVAMRQYAESLAWSRASRRTATSGADGSYVVDGLPDARLAVEARLDGWRLVTTSDPAGRRVQPMMGDIRPGATVNFVGTPITGVRFDVRLPDGSSPPSASIEWRSGNSGSGAGWTPNGAPTDVEAGTWKVTARSGDEGLLVSEPVDVVVEPGKPVSVRLDLREQPAIRIRFHWSEGEAFPTPIVRVAEIGPDDRPDASQLSGTGVRREQPWLQTSGGTHLIRNVVPGRYVVGVTRFEGDPNVALASAVVSTSAVDVDVTIPPVPRGLYVVVRVLDSNGKPIPDAEMQLAMKSSARSWSGGGTTLRRPDGSMWVFPQQRGEVPRDAHFWAIATVRDLGTAAAEYVAGDAPEATIRFQAVARVEIVCEGLKGSRLLSNVTVGVSPTGEWRSFTGRSGERFSREGVATVGPIQPVPSEIGLIYSSNEWGGSVLARVPIDVTPGSQRVVVTLPRLHAVTFKMKPGGGSIYLRRDDDPSWRRSMQVSGEVFVVDAMPDGVYKVNAPDRSAVSFTLPGTTEVDLR